MPRSRKTTTSTLEPSPSRTVVSYPPSTWLARLKEELVLAGVEHDRADLIARRVISGLIPQEAKLEMVDRGADSALGLFVERVTHRSTH